MFFRLVLVLAITAGLVLFTWSNLQPIALTFLGFQTPAFPLALWVLGAIGAGILTTLIIRILFGLSNYATGRAVRAQFRQGVSNRFDQFRRAPFQTGSSTSNSQSAYTKANSGGDSDAAWKNWEGYEEPVNRKETSKQTAAASDDDWDLDSSDDWETDTRSTPVDRHRAEAASTSRNDFEVQQEPKSASRSGSSYSYGYRDPGETGVGKREKVVDAEYRVIVPPYNPPVVETPAPESEAEENADDWFEEDK
jgi:hypothetical protein